MEGFCATPETQGERTERTGGAGFSATEGEYSRNHKRPKT